MDNLTAIVILVPMILGLIIGGKLVNTWLRTKENPLETESLKEIAENYDNDVQVLKKEVSHWRGKFNSQIHKVKVDGDYNLDDDDSLVSLAKSILPEVSNLLPESAKPYIDNLLKNPDMLDILASIHQKFPSETKKILGAFVKTNGKGTKPDAAIEDNTIKLQQLHGA